MSPKSGYRSWDNDMRKNKDMEPFMVKWEPFCGLMLERLLG
jgi:hypothetical protein